MAATITLYGNISEYNMNAAMEIVAKIKSSQREDVINLHVHSYGGSVTEGNMIYNAIRASKTPVDAYVDGVAASMAAVIVQACRKVYMAENAFLMIHSPAAPVTSGRGLAKDHLEAAKVLGAMTDSFVKSLSAQTGRAVTDVQMWMDGTDHWFSAKDALEENLIDGITDNLAPVSELSSTDLVHADITQVYALYTAQFEKITPKTNDMENENLEKKVADLEAQLAAANAARETAEATLKAQAAAEITALLDSLKLTPEQRTSFQAIGEQMGIATLRAAVAHMTANAKPQQTNFAAMAAQGGGGFDPIAAAKKWDELDRAGELAALREKDPDQFRALFEARFGHKPINY